MLLFSLDHTREVLGHNSTAVYRCFFLFLQLFRCGHVGVYNHKVLEIIADFRMRLWKDRYAYAKIMNLRVSNVYSIFITMLENKRKFARGAFLS